MYYVTGRGRWQINANGIILYKWISLPLVLFLPPPESGLSLG
jgi:hypothetical protein